MATDTVSIINTILADVNAVVPNFTSLVSSYRLLVGAAEEIHRTPDVPFEIFERAVIRYDRAGTLIDILLELLCCKIAFSSEFLSVTCAPIDLVRRLANCSTLEGDSCRTAEQIVVIEVLRRALDCIDPKKSCFGPPPNITPTPPPTKPPTQSPPVTPATPAPQATAANTCPCPNDGSFIPTDLETITELETEAGVQPLFTSPLRRKHI